MRLIDEIDCCSLGAACDCFDSSPNGPIYHNGANQPFPPSHEVSSELVKRECVIKEISYNLSSSCSLCSLSSIIDRYIDDYNNDDDFDMCGSFGSCPGLCDFDHHGSPSCNCSENDDDISLDSTCFYGDIDTVFLDEAADADLIQQHPRKVAETATAEVDLYLPSHDSLLSTLPDEIIYRITSFLDAQSLLLSLGCVNKEFNTMVQDNEAGWDTLCRSKWNNKCHISTQAIKEYTTSCCITTTSNRRSNNKYVSYKLALQDAQERDDITLEELCYNVELNEGTIWSFRFKEAAGTEWTSADPWHKGQLCRKFVFLPNGTMKEAVLHKEQPSLEQEEDSLLAVDLEQRCCSRSLVRNSNNNAGQQYQLVDLPVLMTWRFISHPMDLLKRKEVGSYIRISIDGQDVPTYAISRSRSLDNWGFMMESCWGLWASFELPPKQQKNRMITTRVKCEVSETKRHKKLVKHHPRKLVKKASIESQRRQTISLSKQVPKQLTSIDRCLQDDTLLLSNDIQWREAFLYNVGAQQLPDGEEAISHFNTLYTRGRMN